MPAQKVRTFRRAPCALAAALFMPVLAAQDIDLTMHRDGFEALDAPALVRDAVERSHVLRLGIGEYWYSTLALPPSLAAIGADDPYPAGPALASLESGALVLDFGGDLTGETLGFAAWEQAGALRWACGNAPTPIDATLLSGTNASALTSLPDAVLPDVCRSDVPPAVQIHEAINASANPRLAVVEHYVMHGALPMTLAETGLADPYPAGRVRMQLVDGVLVIGFVGGELDAERLAFAPWLQADVVRWVCGQATPPPDATPLATGTASAQTTLDPALLPANCN